MFSSKERHLDCLCICDDRDVASSSEREALRNESLRDRPNLRIVVGSRKGTGLGKTFAEQSFIFGYPLG
uniref:Uncharacterized protein n=1 Tax=Ditylenchus dipsaci TaxID=166011 RepID=A0A915DHA9_9BILA